MNLDLELQQCYMDKHGDHLPAKIEYHPVFNWGRIAWRGISGALFMLALNALLEICTLRLESSLLAQILLTIMASFFIVFVLSGFMALLTIIAAGVSPPVTIRLRPTSLLTSDIYTQLETHGWSLSWFELYMDGYILREKRGAQRQAKKLLKKSQKTKTRVQNPTASTQENQTH